MTFTVTPLKPPGFHEYVLAPVPVIEVELPLQIIAFVTVVPTGGNGFTVTSRVAVFVQPVAVKVPVTVYVVVEVGDTVIEPPLNEPGIHVYVFAPVPVIVTDEPIQIAVEDVVVPVGGKGFTVIVLVAVVIQPVALVPVTVYVVVAVGATFTEAPLKLPGIQL